MPIRAHCAICCDFFDHSKDVAAVPCGHTFHHECLLQWFQKGPTKTCPRCRKQVSNRQIISRLFFDADGEETHSADPESLENELNRLRALLSAKERDCRDKQKTVDSLKDSVDNQKRDLGGMQKEISKKDMLCSALKKQMAYLETQHEDSQAAKDEARRLRTKIKTFESLDVLLQGQRAEVESMITDMGVSHAAVEQLSIYCISLKKEYDNLKGSLKSSNDMCERLRREVLTSNDKFQKASAEVHQRKEDMKSLQHDLANADKEISSLKKKVEFLQKSLSTPKRTNEVLSRLVFESPVPMELKQPCLHQPIDGDDIDLNLTYDVTTPDDVAKRPVKIPTKKMRLDHQPASVSKHNEKASTLSKAREKDTTMDPFMRNSLLFRNKTFGGMLDPRRKLGSVHSGYDGLGGRTKFIQPSPLADIRPLKKARRKKVSRPPPKMVSCLTLDSFLE
ncbi:E3 ubiquitin-protein ligase TRAIP [Phyllopteryx taeniolatus]|uniref:E3 ubiquitin-protein ligase TRAIP n=1 Tax=Phyllopteryx taeniolatus TaxID=161469 RepID=UPI002AD5220D|nr:E3 ubiquitin-protein ligase TRAIP [Phyllopteryx taeniolatus]